MKILFTVLAIFIISVTSREFTRKKAKSTSNNDTCVKNTPSSLEGRYGKEETKLTEILLTIPKVEDFNGNKDDTFGRYRRHTNVNKKPVPQCVACGHHGCPKGYVSINGECIPEDNIKGSD